MAEENNNDVILYTTLNKCDSIDCAGLDHIGKKTKTPLVKAQFGPAFCNKCRGDMPTYARYGFAYINEDEGDILSIIRRTHKEVEIMNWLQNTLREMDPNSNFLFAGDKQKKLYEQAIERFNSTKPTSPDTSITTPLRRSASRGIENMTLADDESYPSDCYIMGDSSDIDFP